MGNTLLDEARAEGSVPGPKCDVERIALPHARADEILDLMRDKTIPAAVAMRIFDRNGIGLGRATIERHRKNECGCCKRAGREF